MKLKTTLIYFSFCLLGTVFGQQIAPVDGTVMHNDAQRSCLTVKLDLAPKVLENMWEDYLKSNHKTKLSGAGFLGMGNLLEAKEVVISAISTKTMDFYTNIEGDENGSEMKVFVAFGYDVYVNATDLPEEYKATKRLMQDFMKATLPPYYQDGITATEKDLKKLTKKGKKLDKLLTKNAEKIEKLENQIKEAKEESATNTEAQKEANEKLKGQQKKLEGILKQLNNF